MRTNSVVSSLAALISFRERETMSKTAMLIGVSALGLMALTSGPASAGHRDDWGRGHDTRYWYPDYPGHYAPYRDYYNYGYYPYPYAPYADYSYDDRPYNHENDGEEEEEGER
jgi:hypothetical protein